jgi:alkaline phosphatase
VVGLFNEANMTVEVNKAKGFPDAGVTEEPSLAEMTDKALALLEDSEEGEDEGFFLQVEGAQIDKRSHANDAAQTIGEILAFDDAVAAAKEYAEKDGNTLVIVTADHECAGFTIVARDSFTNAEATTPPLNQAGTSSTETPARAEAQELDPERSTGAVNGDGNGNPANFAPATFRTADDPAGVEDGSLEASLWLTYLSGNHTGQDVPLYAYGPGSDSFEDRNDNTDLFGEMTAALRGLSG